VSEEDTFGLCEVGGHEREWEESRTFSGASNYGCCLRIKRPWNRVPAQRFRVALVQ